MLNSMRFEAESVRISAHDESVKKLAEIVSRVCQVCEKLQDTVEAMQKDARGGKHGGKHG